MMMCDCRSYWPASHLQPAAAPFPPAVSYYPQFPPYQSPPPPPLSQPPPSTSQLAPQIDLRAYYYDHASYTPNSTSRQMRNQAEKQRRDKLNTFISELALLVPMVSSSAKKLDKTSILRLSATFLRMHQILMSEQKGQLPKNLSIRMCQFLKTLFDGMDGVLMVLTTSGKVVFISENVEQYLGHHQNDLMGTKLADITHRDDHAELEFNLKPPEDDDLFKINGTTDENRPDKRSFFLRLKVKSASKSTTEAQPQYELVHVEGHLRVPRAAVSSQGRSKTHAFDRYLKAHLSANNGYDGKGDGAASCNDTILIAVLKPYKERRVMDNSILEAYKEEWFTRHLLDGTIVFADHRISVLSGYMSLEVSGDSAFKFMHRDDVRWVMIALRQMFCSGSSYGWSAYRLLMKNGEYMYLRTQGYLEKDDSSPNAKSFICVNTLLSPHEGEGLIAEMKRQFTPLVQKSMDPLASPPQIACSPMSIESSSDVVDLPQLNTNDSRELQVAIDLLLSDLKEVIAQTPPPEQADPDLAKVEIVSKALPPIEIQTRKIGAKLPSFAGKYNRPSVITSITGSSERQKRPSETQEVPAESDVKRLRSDTKSVIETNARSVIKRNDPETTYDLDSNILFNTELILSSGTPFSHVSDEDSLRLPEEGNSSELWDSSVSDLDEGVLRGHLHLENRIQSQGVQLEEIEEDLETVPLQGSNIYSHITDLKAEHRKQQEMLKNLQQDHQNIHQIYI